MTLLYFVFVHGYVGGLETRAVTEVGRMQVLGDPAGRELFVRRALRIAKDNATWPTVAFAVLGIGSAISRARRDAMMRATLLVFAVGLGTAAFTMSLGDPSQTCWFVLPAVIFVALGIIEFVERTVAVIPSRAVANTAAAAVLVAAAIPEWDSYATLQRWWRLDSPPQPWNATEQFAHIVRRISHEPNESAARTLQVLPEKSMPVDRGGFSRQLPFEFFEQHPRASEFRFFSSSEELTQILDAFEAGRLRQTRLVLWLSFQPKRAAMTPEMLEPALAGRSFKVRLVTFQEGSMPVPLSSWRMVFEKGR